MPTKPLSLSTYLIITIIIFLMAFWLRISNLGVDSFWRDEAYTAQTIQIARSSAGFVAGVQERLNHMPLYFGSLLLYPGDFDDFTLRYPSVLWSLLTVAMMMRILSHIYQFRRYALFAGFLLAVQSFVILQSRTARMYPMANFFIATSTYFFLQYLDQPDPRKRYWIWMCFASLLAYLTHIATIIMIPAQGLTLMWQVIKRRVPISRLFYWGATQAILIIPSIAWILLVFDRQVNRLTWIEPPSLESILFVIGQLYYGHLDFLSISPERAIIFALLPLLVLIPALLTRRILYWLSLTWLTFLALLVVSLIKPIFHERYLAIVSFAYIALLVMSYKAFGDWMVGRFRLAGKVIVGLIIGVHLTLVIFTTFQRHASGTFAINFRKQAMEYIITNAREGDVVVALYHAPEVNWYMRNATHLERASDAYLDDYSKDVSFPDARVWVALEAESPNYRILREHGLEPLYSYGKAIVFLIETDE